MIAANHSSQFNSIRSFFTVERTLLIIFAVALILRFLFIDIKLMHHDETIHAWFSANLLGSGIFSYSYDPVYHGPFLYFVTAGMFGLFGLTDAVGRIIPSLLGSLMILLVYPIYKLGYLNNKQALICALFLAISPSFVYFSRFLRNDIFLAFFTMVILVAVLYYLERHELKYVLIGAAAAGCAMSCKENAPMILLVFGVYLFYLFFIGKKVEVPKKWIRDFILCALVIVGIMIVFYSSFFANLPIIIEGPLKAIEHWLAMHNEQRLGGPFYFYLLYFILYELPILFLGLIAALSFLFSKRKDTECITPKASLEDVSQIESENSESLIPEEYEELFENSSADEKGEADVTTEPISPDIKPPVNRVSVRAKVSELSGAVKNFEFTRFCLFWLIISLVFYAYLGEKVPWLLLHQLLPLIFVAVFAFSSHKSGKDYQKLKYVIAALGTVFLIVMTIHVAFEPNDIAEPIVQVQNSEELREVMEYMNNSTKIGISNYVRWPFVWYSYSDPSKNSYLSDPGYDQEIGPCDYDMIIVHDGENVESIEGFDKKRYREAYWIDAYSLIQSSAMNKDDPMYFNTVIDDLKRILTYYITRDAKLGSINIDVFVKNKSVSL